uniref:DDE_3 domain-containing protein n=1 Tax=Heterorhabditis bacteriophora TaxID=37862 RepID=A0A1I7XDB8_HETBA
MKKFPQLTLGHKDERLRFARIFMRCDWEKLEDNGVATMKWPSRSPDLNPMENLWAFLVCQIYGNNYQFNTVKGLQSALAKHGAKNISMVPTNVGCLPGWDSFVKTSTVEYKEDLGVYLVANNDLVYAHLEKEWGDAANINEWPITPDVTASFSSLAQPPSVANMPPTHLVDFDDYLKYAMESYVADINTDAGKTTIIFTLKEKAGALAETLKVFQFTQSIKGVWKEETEIVIQI